MLFAGLVWSVWWKTVTYFGETLLFCQYAANKRKERDVYPSNVWFITVIAFKSVELLRNNYFKISSNGPSYLLCNVWNFIFYFASAVFRCLSNDIALKGFFLQHCDVFLIILLCDSDFWTVFRGGLFSAWFCCYRTEKVWGSIFLV